MCGWVDRVPEKRSKLCKVRDSGRAGASCEVKGSVLKACPFFTAHWVARSLGSQGIELAIVPFCRAVVLMRFSAEHWVRGAERTQAYWL